MPLPVVLLMGPTASGKTGLAMAIADRLPVELVSVDSAQVYRGMDIGTAKLDVATLARYPHHLVDILDPAEPYSAARFRDDALRLIAQIRGRDRIPLLVGGTMLYFRALQEGLSELPSADPAIRARLEAEARQIGWPGMHARLAELDPASAQRLHPNDSQRIQRALEIVEQTGRPVTDTYSGPRDAGLEGPVVKLALNPPERSEVHRRIARRFHGMMEAGFLDEVRRLKARADLHAELPSIRAVGYRQLWEHLDGNPPALGQAVERGIAATRRFAKRQITWLRSEPGVATIDPADPAMLDKALNLLLGVPLSYTRTP